MVRKLFLTAVLINFTNSTSTAYVLVHTDARACMHTKKLCAQIHIQVAFVVSFAVFVLHTLCSPYTSQTLDHLQTLSLLVICITQFLGIIIAARRDDGEENTQQVVAVLVAFLNILVVVLLPMQLIVRIPALVKVSMHIRKCTCEHTYVHTCMRAHASTHLCS